MNISKLQVSKEKEMQSMIFTQIDDINKSVFGSNHDSIIFCTRYKGHAGSIRNIMHEPLVRLALKIEQIYIAAGKFPISEC